MAAELISHTTVGGPIGAGSANSGTGLVMGVYQATIVTTLDWVVIDDFDEIYHVYATVDASGAHNEAIIDGSTTNKFTLEQTGATTMIVWGTKSNTN